MIKVSIVIPAYNAARTITKTLEACVNQSYPKENFEVIIADDGSTDTTADIVKSFPVKYLFQKNSGPATARNIGWRAAKGDIILFTDSDCVPEKEWITKMLAMFNAGDVAAVGGTYGNVNPEYIVSLCIHHEILYRHSTLTEYVKYLGSFNLGIRKKVLEELNGFDESYKIACGEDADLTYRISYKDYKLRFSRGVEVGHHFPTSFFKFLKQQFWRGYWLMKIFRNHSKRLGNDGYSKFRDTIQPPMYLLILVMIPLCYFKIFLIAWLVLNVFAILIHTPVVAFGIKRSGNYKLLFLYLMLYMRGFFWATGCVRGGLKFILGGK